MAAEESVPIHQIPDNPISRVIVALDVDTVKRAQELAQELQNTGCWLKIGLELYALSGVSLINEFKNMGFRIFLDLKLHDIPTTVERTLRVLAASGADMINVHCQGGYEMMARAAAVCHQRETALIGVTVLTSMDDKQLNTMGVTHNLEDQVRCLAQLAHRAGLDGVVASAHEVPMLRREFNQPLQNDQKQRSSGQKNNLLSQTGDFLLVTPGIRPANCDVNDQARVLTPTAALEAGSSYLVVGRPITQSANPRQALMELF